MAYPATIDINAAPTDDKYAIITAAPSILLAFDFRFVIEEAIVPTITKGTQKNINCPAMYLTVDNICIIPSPTIEPKTIPIIIAIKSFTTMLFFNLLIFSLLYL